MAHKRALEALNRTLKDLRNDTRHFGGALILLSGDFRQTLPVIPRSTPADELNACLKASALWQYVKKLQLKTNMRVALRSDQSAEEFSRQLLAMGNGVIPVELVTGLIEFPQNFCSITTTPDELIMKVFPNIAQNYVDHDWLSARAILAAKNKDVDHLNFVIQNDISGKQGEPLPLSVDVVGCDSPPCDVIKGTTAVMYVHFVATKDNTRNLHAVVHATTLGITVPYDLPEDVANVCDNLMYGATCPIDKTEDVVYAFNFYIDSYYPEISVSVEVSLVDEDNESVACFMCNVKVKKGSTSPWLLK